MQESKLRTTSEWVLVGFLALTPFAVGTEAYAQEPGFDPVAIVLEAKKVVVAADGTEDLGDAVEVNPGDVVEYRATYSNSGKAQGKGLLGTLPVPGGMVFVPGSETPAQITASLDGSSFATPSLKREVTLANGETKLVEVPFSEYRYLRWNLDQLEPGAKRTVSARMQVNR